MISQINMALIHFSQDKLFVIFLTCKKFHQNMNKVAGIIDDLVYQVIRTKLRVLIMHVSVG